MMGRGKSHKEFRDAMSKALASIAILASSNSMRKHKEPSKPQDVSTTQSFGWNNPVARKAQQKAREKHLAAILRARGAKSVMALAG